jgi:hypothetical protein
MNRYIIGFGIPADVADIYSPSLEDALAKARAFSLAQGLSAEESGADDVSWAIPYDRFAARDFGLEWLDDHDRWVQSEARQ